MGDLQQVLPARSRPGPRRPVRWVCPGRPGPTRRAFTGWKCVRSQPDITSRSRADINRKASLVSNKSLLELLKSDELD